jgi:hypothetical protein
VFLDHQTRTALFRMAFQRVVLGKHGQCFTDYMDLIELRAPLDDDPVIRNPANKHAKACSALQAADRWCLGTAPV